MIFHASIPADDPRLVASVIGEIWRAVLATQPMPIARFGAVETWLTK